MNNQLVAWSEGQQEGVEVVGAALNVSQKLCQPLKLSLLSAPAASQWLDKPVAQQRSPLRQANCCL